MTTTSTPFVFSELWVPQLAVTELGTQVSTVGIVHDHDTCLALAQAMMLLLDVADVAT